MHENIVEAGAKRGSFEYFRCASLSRAALAGELAILASHRACMRGGVRGLAAVLLEFPAHPPSVSDGDSIPVTV